MMNDMVTFVMGTLVPIMLLTDVPTLMACFADMAAFMKLFYP